MCRQSCATRDEIDWVVCNNQAMDVSVLRQVETGTALRSNGLQPAHAVLLAAMLKVTCRRGS